MFSCASEQDWTTLVTAFKASFCCAMSTGLSKRWSLINAHAFFSLYSRRVIWPSEPAAMLLKAKHTSQSTWEDRLNSGACARSIMRSIAPSKSALFTMISGSSHVSKLAVALSAGTLTFISWELICLTKSWTTVPSQIYSIKRSSSQSSRYEKSQHASETTLSSRLINPGLPIDWQSLTLLSLVNTSSLLL